MATYNLFPSNPPASTASTDTGSTITSTEFLVTATCWVVQIRWFRPNSTVTGVRTAQIWRQDSQTTGTAIGPQHTLPMPEAASWGTYDLTEAIELTPGRYRIAVMHSLGRFQRADSYFSTGPGVTQYVNGPVTRVAGGNTAPTRQAAWVTTTSNIFPTTHSASGFFDDIVVSDVKPVPVTIGAMQDYTNLSFANSTGSSSLYHLYADGRTSAPNGLVVQLHGDGAGEFASPDSGVLAAYNNVAKANNMLMLAPRSPDNVGSRTWWENAASPVWLLDLLDYIRSKYAINENKIWFMGFSGGAEVQTYFLLPDYSNRIGSGGNIMLGGGGATGLVFGRQPTAAFKTTQRLHWAVGSLDSDDGTGWSALNASQVGHTRYGTTESFSVASREVIPGKTHLTSEAEGPRVLAEQLALAYPAPVVTAPGNIFKADPSGWESTDGPLNLGTQFTVTEATKITAARYYKASTAHNGLPITMTLYGANTTALATATRTQLASDPIGWVTVNFTTPVSVTTGTTYVISWRSTGTSYFVTQSFPLTATTSAPFALPANHALYLYGAQGKPSGVGAYSYAIDAVAEGGGTPVVVKKSVMALDTDNSGLTQAWFNARYAEGVRLFITSGTPWSPTEPVTLNTPRTEVQGVFAMAIAAGMKIGLYTRNPNHYNAGLDAAGPYISQLQFFALDVEPDPGTPVTQAMMNGVAARGVRPIVYAGSGFWASVQGSNTTAFSSYPLWDTQAEATFNYNAWKANPDFMAPAPVAYGGWNVPGNYRVGVQQKFEHVIDGISVDLNSFDESFLREVSGVGVGPDQTVNSWDPVTLTATGSGTWTQTSGAPQTLQVSGTTLTFTATPSMADQTLVFSFGGQSVRVTVLRSAHGLVGSGGSVVPVRLRKQ